MQRPSVDGRFVIIMRISSRSAQVRRPYNSIGQVSSCRERTPGVPRWKTWANAIRTGDGKTLYYRKKLHNQLFQPMQQMSVDGRFVIIMRIPSRSAQVHRPYNSIGQVSSCRERTPGVPRWKTWANAIRTGDGKTLYYRKKLHNQLFQPMQQMSVDGRFVIIMRIPSRSAQVHRPYNSIGQVSSCRERTPGVPR